MRSDNDFTKKKKRRRKKAQQVVRLRYRAGWSDGTQTISFRQRVFDISYTRKHAIDRWRNCREAPELPRIGPRRRIKSYRYFSVGFVFKQILFFTANSQQVWNLVYSHLNVFFLSMKSVCKCDVELCRDLHFFEYLTLMSLQKFINCSWDYRKCISLAYKLPLRRIKFTVIFVT